jgi:hypothetical protein
MNPCLATEDIPDKALASLLLKTRTYGSVPTIVKASGQTEFTI